MLIMVKYAKTNRISGWKNVGLIHDDYDMLYDKWFNCKNCEKCGHDFSYWKKCMDHCHVTGLFRNILCLKCNSNLRMDNTSGIPNISIDGGGWAYRKQIKKVKLYKWFKTKEEAINYKESVEMG